MNIKVKNVTWEELSNIPKEKKVKPKKPNIFWRTLLKILSSVDLKKTNFSLEEVGMSALNKKTPCLILMNHTSFIDLKIAEYCLFPRPLNIVTTADGFIGLNWLLRQIGCFPTRKFTPERQVVQDVKYCLEKLKTSVLMFPEAGYSLDGTATTLPDSLGKCIKYLGVPVVTLISSGAYLRQPLFNNLHKRNVNVSAKLEYLLPPEDVKALTAEEINAKIKQAFGFDAYRQQQENDVLITEKNRAEGLERILYKCPHCLVEGRTVGKNATLTCTACQKEYLLTENGKMQAIEGETEIAPIPTWYAWERKCVREELLANSYAFEDEVEVFAVVNSKALYRVGNGKLVHGMDGFILFNENGEQVYTQKPLYSYSLNVDFFWYEIGDVICIGTSEITYCCIPKTKKGFVAKTRLAAEELYKIKRAEK